MGRPEMVVIEDVSFFSGITFFYYFLYAFAVVFLFKCLKTAPVDHISCHLMCLNTCFAIQLYVDLIAMLTLFSRSIFRMLHVFVYHTLPLSYLLNTYYITLGTCLFLTNALYQYNRANIKPITNRAAFTGVWFLALLMAAVEVAAEGRINYVTAMLVFAGFTAAIFLIFALLAAYCCTSQKVYFSRKNFGFCVLYALFTVGMCMPRYIDAWFIVFGRDIKVSEGFYYTLQYNIQSVHRLFPMVTIVLAFCFFSALRHGAYVLPWLPTSPSCTLSAAYSRRDDALVFGRPPGAPLPPSPGSSPYPPAGPSPSAPPFSADGDAPPPYTAPPLPAKRGFDEIAGGPSELVLDPRMSQSYGMNPNHFMAPSSSTEQQSLYPRIPNSQ